MYGPFQLGTALRPEHLQLPNWHFFVFGVGDFVQPLTCPCCWLQHWAWRARLAAAMEKP